MWLYMCHVIQAVKKVKQKKDTCDTGLALEMREAGPMVMVMVVKDDWYEEIAFLCMCLIISVSVFINS